MNYLLNILYKIIQSKIEEMVEKKMEERWEERYKILIENGKEIEKNCRDEVKNFLSKAELPPLISVIRQELEKIIKNNK